jgi:cytochrome c-type biogenesis protein CcmH/NrfG
MLNQMESGSGSRSEAQRRADRIRILREELDELERSRVLELSTDQRTRFDEWSAARLRELATEYDVDTTVSQKRVSWGLRITSTLGGLALCAAVVLFFNRYWGYLPTSAQVAIVMLAPLAALWACPNRGPGVIFVPCTRWLAAPPSNKAHTLRNFRDA